MTEVFGVTEILDRVARHWPGEKARILYSIGVQASLLRAELAEETGAELIGVTPLAPFAGTTLQELLDEIMGVAPPSGGTSAQFLRGDNVWANGLVGPLGIGGTPAAGRVLDITRNITGSIGSVGAIVESTIQSDVTASAYGYRTTLGTQATSFTAANIFHFGATQGTIGAGSTVTTQVGFRVASTLTGATNNYGFFSDLAAATGRWNFYANGTANNYFAGRVGVGTTDLALHNLYVNKTITGGATAGSVTSTGAVQSDVTTTAMGFYSIISTAASAFTLGNVIHFRADQGTIGSGSAVTNQFGFRVESSLTGATNNYGFWSNIAAATGRWNFYAAGTARNFMAGSLGLGSTTDVPSALLYMTSTTQGFRPPGMTTAQRDAISAPAAGLVIYNTTTNKLNVYTTAWEAVTSA